jgi:hypothetical protein
MGPERDTPEVLKQYWIEREAAMAAFKKRPVISMDDEQQKYLETVSTMVVFLNAMATIALWRQAARRPSQLPRTATVRTRA